MHIDRNTHVADAVANLPGAAGALDALGIDYSSPGERSIAEAAGLEGVDPDAVVLQLRKLPADERTSWLDRPIRDLIAYLQAQHERLTRDDLVRVAEELADICSGPLGSDEALQRLRQEFKALSGALLPHLRREQVAVFPLLQRVESLWQSNAPLPEPGDGVTQAIQDLLVDHGSIGALARGVRDLRMALESRDITPRCRAILRNLSRLESDLRQSMFLENCILFPRALALQESLLRSPVTKQG